MNRHALTAGERGVILLVGLGLVVSGLVLFLPLPAGIPSVTDPIPLPQAQVIVPTFLLEPPRVDLNAATADELRALPGIGEVLASRIVAYRQAHGPFRSLDELRNVSGIGAKVIDALRGAVTLGN